MVFFGKPTRCLGSAKIHPLKTGAGEKELSPDSTPNDKPCMPSYGPILMDLRNLMSFWGADLNFGSYSLGKYILMGAWTYMPSIDQSDSALVIVFQSKDPPS